MSSYINIYLKLKDSEDKKLLKFYSRSTEMYDLISDTCNPQTSYEEIQYTEITPDNIADMKYEVEKRLKSCEDDNKLRKKKYDETLKTLSEALSDSVVKLVNSKHKRCPMIFFRKSEERTIREVINAFRKEIEDVWDNVDVDMSYQDDLKQTLDEINGLESLMVDISLGYSDFDKIFCSLT